MATDSGSYFRGLYLMLAEYAGDDIGHVIQLHYLSVHDCVCLQILVAHTDQVETATFTLQFHRLDGTGTNVQAHKIIFADAFFKHDLFSPRNQLSAQAVNLSQAKAGFARS